MIAQILTFYDNSNFVFLISPKRKLDFINFHFVFFSISILFPAFPSLLTTLSPRFPAFPPWFHVFLSIFPSFPPLFPAFLPHFQHSPHSVPQFPIPDFIDSLPNRTFELLYDIVKLSILIALNKGAFEKTAHVCFDLRED